jgi:hypothetical protein
MTNKAPLWRTVGLGLAALALASIGADQAAAVEHGCEVTVKSYLLYADPSYMTGTTDPTATPVPTSFQGLVDLNVRQTGASTIKVCLS